MKTPREAKHVHPDAWWWMKADGCKILSRLKESMKMEWSGDVDLNDTNLHKQYKTFVTFLNGVGVRHHKNK